MANPRFRREFWPEGSDCRGKGKSFSDVANDLLEKEIAIIEAAI